MRKDVAEVRTALRKKVLAGYEPERTLESAEDHWMDWFLLGSEEFEEIKRQALADRPSHVRERKPFLSPQRMSVAVRALLGALLATCDTPDLEEAAKTLRRSGLDVHGDDLESLREALRGGQAEV